MQLTPLKTRPIPFMDPLRASPAVYQSEVTPAFSAPKWQPELRANLPVRAQPKVRMASARYDGDYSLNVRSCTTGQVYRFTHPGAVLNVHAADISMLKRIEQLTVLV